MTNGRLAEDAEALWYVAPGRAEMRRETVPALAPGEALVRALHGAISRGTERLVLAGRVPPSEYARMRGPHMGGDFPFPVKYGYAAVGVVEAGPPALLGRRVFCLHPHQDLAGSRRQHGLAARLDVAGRHVPQCLGVLAQPTVSHPRIPNWT